MQQVTPQGAAETIKVFAREAGFDLVGIARARPSAYPEAYASWIAAGKHGAMTYLARGIDDRVDVTKKFPWAQSVLSLGLSYWQQPPQEEQCEHPGRDVKIAR